MEVTLNTNHAQVVSTQCSKPFLGMHVVQKKKKEKEKERKTFWSRFSQISWPKQ